MQEVVGNGKHYPRDWHKWLPGNNGLYDENSSGEQDAMKEVSGTEKGLVSNIIKGAVAGGKAAAKAVVAVGPGGLPPRSKPFYDENPSGEQAAMQEVVGNGKHYPRDWHKWLPGNNGLYDETPSGSRTRCRRLSGMGNIIRGIGICGFLETTACMMKTRLASKTRCRRLSGMANTIQRIGISGFLETTACMMKTLLTSSGCAGRVRSSPEPELFERSTPLALLIANSRELATERQL